MAPPGGALRGGVSRQCPPGGARGRQGLARRIGSILAALRVRSVAFCCPRPGRGLARVHSCTIMWSQLVSPGLQYRLWVPVT